METYEHELTFTQNQPPDYSKYFNYMDYTYEVKVSKPFDDSQEYSARYYLNGEIMGIFRFKYVQIGGTNKPLNQNVVLLITANCDKLIANIVAELNITETYFVEMSNAIQLHATKKVREFIQPQ